MAKLLYLSKQVHPDLLLAVSFLSKRVQNPDIDDYKKLGLCIQYLRDTKNFALTLETTHMSIVHWWVGALFAVHPNCHSHTGAMHTMGIGCFYSMSTKQKLNTHSSTEAKLVAINDATGMILWVRHFLEAQGFTVSDNNILQDNESTMHLAKNGRQSSRKQTKHIDVQYYFVTNNIK